MVAVKDYNYNQPKYRPQRAPQPRPRRTTERERQRRVASRAERILEQQRVLDRERRADARRRYLARQRVLRQTRTIVLVCFVFAILTISLAGYAIVTEARIHLNTSMAELQKMQAELVDLETEVMAITDISVLRQKAMERLDMGQPESYQIVTISPPASTASTVGGSN